MREGPDNIITILKSIAPIKHKFSRKNKEFDKTFKNMSLEYLLRTLDYHPKIHDEQSPSPEFLNHKNQYDINFQNSCNYIKEFSDLNNLPLVMNNRNCLKNGTFNPDYELNPVKNKEEQKLIILEKEKRKKERLQDRLERLKKWRESDSSLDPGKYHPNYDYIRKKITNVYIRKPIKKEENEKNSYKYKYKNNENKKGENNKDDNKNKIDKNSNNNSKINSKDESKGINNKMEGGGDKNKNNISSTNLNESHSFINNSSINNNNSSKLTIIRNIRNIRNIKRKTYKKNNNRNNSNILDNNNTLTISDINNNSSNNNNKSAIIEDLPTFHINKHPNNINSVKNVKNKNLSLPKIGVRKIKNIKTLKKRKNRFRSSSLGNMKNPIVFRKMLGRDDAAFSNNNLNLISYYPNYDSMMPHIPSTIFKYKKNPQNYKKFITGKIIRGYNYSPEKYFVIEFKKNKVKKININKEREKIKEILKKKVEN